MKVELDKHDVATLVELALVISDMTPEECAAVERAAEAAGIADLLPERAAL